GVQTCARPSWVERPRPPTSDRLPRPAPPGAAEREREREPREKDSQPKMTVEDVLAPAPDITKMDGGVEVGIQTPNVVVDQPLEAHLETPTVVDKAIGSLADAGGEERAAQLSPEIEARELGEHCWRRLPDEARAIKAFSRALNLVPSLRPNLGAIRRVFYRRALWPNLQKLVDAEMEYARDDYERADLLLEKARISNHRLN